MFILNDKLPSEKNLQKKKVNRFYIFQNHPLISLTCDRLLLSGNGQRIWAIKNYRGCHHLSPASCFNHLTREGLKGLFCCLQTQMTQPPLVANLATLHLKTRWPCIYGSQSVQIPPSVGKHHNLKHRPSHHSERASQGPRDWNLSLQTWAQLFKWWKALSKGYITTQQIRVKKMDYAIHR